MVYKDEVAFFAKLKQDGSVALMRHALAPGGGDPENFALNQRETQRNLSQAGRDQATAIGERFRANGIKQARVFTSQWYRCRDTAELLGLGPVTQLPALNSFFRRPADREPNLRSLKHWLATADLRQPTILVTHQVTITAMSDIFPASGEIILLHKQDGNWVVADRFLVEP